MARGRYETLIEKAEALERAAISADDPTMKKCWIYRAQQLRTQAEELSIEDA